MNPIPHLAPAPAVMPAAALAGALHLLAGALYLLVAGCGGGSAQVDRDEAFARIQVEEARIEHAAVPDLACDELACAEVHDAADRICAIAGEIEDRDAIARCDRARARATGCDALEASCTSGGGV